LRFDLRWLNGTPRDQVPRGDLTPEIRFRAASFGKKRNV
jgi:hypothetical protein